MEEEVLKSIDEKLSTIIHLLAGNSIQGKNKTEAIITLASLSVDVETIANIVDTSVKTVRNRLYEARKEGKRKAKKSKKSEQQA